MGTGSSKLGTVVIVGGGYAGVLAAQSLDKAFHVVLIDKKEYFYHMIGAIRSTVEDMTDQLVIPYASLLKDGVFLQGSVSNIVDNTVTVEGLSQPIRFDYLVVATGSTNAFPAAEAGPRFGDMRAALQTLRERVAAAQRILIVGGGPVGVEVAGEIGEHRGNKRVVLAHRGKELLVPIFHGRRITQRLADQLAAHGVEVLCGTPVDVPADARRVAGTHRLVEGPVRVRLGDRGEEEFDLVIEAVGGRVNAGAYRESSLAGAVEAETGRLRVGPDLRVEGRANVFAVGDCASTGALALGYIAMEQGKLVAKSIAALARAKAKGAGPPRLKPFRVPPTATFVTVGRNGGAGQLPTKSGAQVGPGLVRALKGRGLFIKAQWKSLGYGGVRAAESRNAAVPAVTEERLAAIASALGAEPGSLRALVPARP